MGKIEYRVSPTGGLDKSNNPLAVDDKDFTEALDITAISPNNLNSNQNLRPYNNVDYAFNIGSISTQVKQYRVSIDWTGIEVGQVAHFSLRPSKNGAWDVNAYAVNLQILYGYDSSMVFTDISYNFSISAFPTATLSDADTSVSTSLSFTIQIDSMGNTDWFLDYLYDTEISSFFPTITINALQDAITNEKVGDLIPIAFANVGEFVFVFSTTGNQEPIVTSGLVAQDNGTNYYINTTSNNDEYLLQGTALEYVSLNGYWTIDNSGNIVGSNTPPLGAGAIYGVTATKYQRTANCIGVAYKNTITGEWVYTELLRSVNLNFRTYHAIQVQSSTFDDGYIFDFTDNNNQMKRLIYRGDFVENGFLSVYNSAALYDLDSIEQESKLQQPANTAKITLKTANKWIYRVEGRKPSATYAAFVRFFDDDGLQGLWSESSNIVWTRGDNAYQQNSTNTTTMSLRIRLEQIPYQLYTKYQVGIIEFGSVEPKGYLLPIEQINGLEEIVTFDTGFDTSLYIDWDFKYEIPASLPNVFNRVKSILDYDNYVIALNYEKAAPYDLNEWASTFEWSTQVGDIPVNLDYIQYQSSQWIGSAMNNPLYMSDEYMGYMPYEDVLFGIKVWWKNGAPPSWFPCIKIAHDNYDVTDNGSPTTNLKYNFFNVTNVNLDYQIASGERVIDIVEDFRFGRADVERAVIATGLGIAGVSFLPSTEIYPYYYGQVDNTIKNVFILHSPDIINQGLTLESSTGDFIKYAQLIKQNVDYSGSSAINALDYFGSYQNSLITEDVNKTQNLSIGQWGDFINLTLDDVVHRAAVVIELPNDIAFDNNEYFYNIYYIKPYSSNGSYVLGNKAYQMFTVPQDKWYDANSHTAATPYSVYGGSTFTNKSYYKTDEGASIAQIVGFYSFNRTNGSLRSGYFPAATIGDYYQQPLSDDNYTYDPCFTPKHILQLSRPISDIELDAVYTFPNTVSWSEKHLANQLQGNNRNWNVVNQKALEPNWGQINAAEIVNTRMVVLQDRKITTQYFNNSAKLITEDSEALLGTGSIMGIKGVDLSQFGTSHKWSVIKGKATNGSDTLYWYSAYGKKIMRLAGDGISPISDMGNIANFLQKYTKYFDIATTNNPDTPTDNWGIYGVWNDQKKEAIWTFRGCVKYTTWNGTTSYLAGDWVTDGTTFGFDGLPVLYKAKYNNTNQPLTNPAFWQRYDTYDAECFELFTLVWSELENKFKCNLTFMPKLYGSYMNSAVSVSPQTTKYIYEHNGNNNARYFCTLPLFVEDVYISYLGIGSQDVNGTTYTSNNFICANLDGYDIASLYGISAPYTPTLDNHTGYYIYNPDTKEYYRIIDFLAPNVVVVSKEEPVSADFGTVPLYYSTCNTGQPSFKQILNKAYPRYMNFTNLSMNINKPPMLVEHTGVVDSNVQKVTATYNESGDFENYQGRKRAQIPMDITNENDRSRGFQGIEGYYLEENIKFTPNIENNLQDYSVIMVEQNKKIK